MKNDEIEERADRLARHIRPNAGALPGAAKEIAKLVREAKADAYEEAEQAVRALVVSGLYAPGFFDPDHPAPWEATGGSVQVQAVDAIRALKESLEPVPA